MRKYVIGFIIGAIVFGSIVKVGATILYSASEVGFTPTNPNWQVNNLEDAINELYNIKNSNNVVAANPITIDFGSWEMGYRSGYTNINKKITNVNNYTTADITCSGNMGTWITAYVYVDDELIETIDDLSTHTVVLQNNNEIKINYISKSNLNNGVAGTIVDLK